MDLNLSSFKQISSAVKAKKISAFEVTEFFSKKIKSLDGKLNSFITINDHAAQEAKIIDERIFLMAIYDKSEMENIDVNILKERLNRLK